MRYQALPLPAMLPPRQRVRVPAYPPGYARVPAPLALPWALKTMASASYGADRLPDGRQRFWIRHDVLRGVTPAMLAWWFAHLEGDVMVEGRPVNRYRCWHPHDHVHASYAQRLPDGSVGPGAVIHLKEFLGGNPDYLVDVHTRIEKLDEEGFIHNPIVHGVTGMARMEYTFRVVPGGTLFENCLVIGGADGWRQVVRPLVERIAFPPGKGEAWLRHNIEEVGMFENFLPRLWREETGAA